MTENQVVLAQLMWRLLLRISAGECDSSTKQHKRPDPEKKATRQLGWPALLLCSASRVSRLVGRRARLGHFYMLPKLPDPDDFFAPMAG